VEKLADRIKGITIEIGGDTTGLSKALSGVNKEIKDTQTQLKDVNRLLKMDPGNTELLRQKYDLLNKSIDSTEKKLDTLKQAEKQVQDQFKRGKVSESQYNALKREVIATESNLKNLKSEAQKTDNAIRGIDEKPVEEVASAADKAETSLKDAGKEASNFGDYLKAGAIVEGSKAIISGMKDIADESREYMKIMGSLEISSQAAGYTAEQTASSYETLVGVLGDSQTAATTTANLQALGLSQSDLTQLINGTIGAWAAYGDSIPIDSLSEAINETVKTGNVTGTFADVLNWAGASEDEFNAKLQAAGSESERANLVLQQLANQGLMQAGAAWQENNKTLTDSNKANDNLQKQLAELGEMIMPIITTVTQGVANILSWLTNLSPEVKNIIGLVATVITTIAGVAAIIQGITAAQAALNAVMNANPISLIIMAIAALVAAFIYLWNNCEEFREFWINLWDTISSAFSAVWDAIVNFFTVTIPDAWNSVVDFFWQGYYTWQSIWQSIGDFFSGIWDGIVSFFTETIPNAWNSLVDFCWQGYYAWQEVWQNVGDFFSGIWDGIVGFFTETIPNAWNGLMDIFNKIGSWWSGIWNGVRDTFSNVFNSLVNIAKQPINAIIGLINGIIDGLNWMIGGLNQFSFDIPDWVPIFGGKKFGINIPTIGKIPYLASGGVLSQGSAVVGEAGPELLTMMGTKAVVQPLTSSTTTNTNLGGVNIVVYGAPGQDVRELADIIMDEMQSATMRKGAVWG
jgi:phage-related minor tail protein